MSNQSSKMKFAGLASVSAIGLSVPLVVELMTGLQPGSFGVAEKAAFAVCQFVGSLLTGVLSDRVTEEDVARRQRENLLLNGDWLRLTAFAVAEVIREHAKQQTHYSKQLHQLANSVECEWPTLARSPEYADAVRHLDRQQCIRFFYEAAQGDPTQRRALDVETWKRILRTASGDTTLLLAKDSSARDNDRLTWLATVLHEQLPSAMYRLLKTTGVGDKARAALMLTMLGETHGMVKLGFEYLQTKLDGFDSISSEELNEWGQRLETKITELLPHADPEFQQRFDELIVNANDCWKANFEHQVEQYRLLERLVTGQEQIRQDNRQLPEQTLELVREYVTPRYSQKAVYLPFQSLGSLFIGREEFLDELHQKLNAANHHATAIVQKAVHGLGGVGKTQLAVEYAWRHVDDYSAVLFVKADDADSLWQNIAGLTACLLPGRPEAAEAEQQTRVSMVLAALREIGQSPDVQDWLLIVDNVDSKEAKAALNELFRQLHGGRVVITSRRTDWSGEVDPLELGVLEPGDAAAYLLQKTDPKTQTRGRRLQDTDEQDALTLAGELDGLALALEQAGAHIARNGLTLAAYLEVWRSHLPDVEAWYDERNEFSKKVAVTWLTTLDMLSDDDKALLNVTAWFAPDPIPDSVVEHFGAARNRPGANIRELLANLADYSMIRRDVQNGSFTVHRVVQEILRQRQEDQAASLTVVLEMLNAARPEGSPDDVRTWSRWDLLRPHVAAAVAEADGRRISEPTSLLMHELGLLYRGQGLHAEATPLYRRALLIGEPVLGPGHPAIAVRLNNLALLLRDTNRPAEAELLMRRALAIDKRSHGPDHSSVSLRLSNLALLLRDTNRQAQAASMLRCSLAIAEQCRERTRADVGLPLNNLSALLRDTAEFGAAELLIRRALAADEQSFGAAHPRVAAHLNELAQVFAHTKRVSEAEPVMRRVCAILESLSDDPLPGYTDALHNLASLLRDTKRFSQAEPLMRRALSIDEKTCGAEHAKVAIRLNNLVTLLTATKRLSEAERFSQRALEILVLFRSATGHDHQHFGQLQRNFSAILAALGFDEDAIAARLREVTNVHGPLASIIPEVERLLGPAAPAQNVLAELDRQYRKQNKPRVWFLPLSEPISPHLDQLLASSLLEGSADESITLHLDKLLGPCPSVDDVLAELDRQYREQNKPGIWFLPLSEPISLHLDELLGPIDATDDGSPTGR